MTFFDPLGVEILRSLKRGGNIPPPTGIGLIKRKKNIIVGCIYKHPSMDIDDFNAMFEKVLEKVSAENKELYLLGDFNIDLLKIEEEDKGNKIDEFYNVLCTNFLVPHITLPTRITTSSATLIDNIFSNNQNFSQAISGNLTVSISDHLPQILFVPMDDFKPPKKQNLYKREKNFDKESLVAHFINVKWGRSNYFF